MVLYLEVTQDRFELPVIVADSLQELAALAGVRKTSICHAMQNAKKKGWKSRYLRVEVEETA